MAVVNVKSGVITNRDALPEVLSNANIAKGMLCEAVGTVESTSGDSIDSVYRFASIPSNARVSQVLLYNDDLGTTTVADVGLHDTTVNGAAVVDRDFFASAVVLNAGANNGVDVTHEAAGAYDIDDAEKMIWQCIAGLTSDPNKMYDLTLMLTAANNGTGTITVKIIYAV
jgi:hypothetical protein